MCSVILVIHMHIFFYRFPIDPAGSFQPLCLSTSVPGLGPATKSRQSGDSIHPPTCTCFQDSPNKYKSTHRFKKSRRRTMFAEHQVSRSLVRDSGRKQSYTKESFDRIIPCDPFARWIAWNGFVERCLLDFQ